MIESVPSFPWVVKTDDEVVAGFKSASNAHIWARVQSIEIRGHDFSVHQVVGGQISPLFTPYKNGR